MEGKDIYILLVFALPRWRRPARLTPERGQFRNKDEAAGALACGGGDQREGLFGCEGTLEASDGLSWGEEQEIGRRIYQA